jgi:hypothetical protein
MTCCGKGDSDPNNLNTDAFHKDFQSWDKLVMIIKIQSQIRAYLARKRVRMLRGTQGTKSMMHHTNF